MAERLYAVIDEEADALLAIDTDPLALIDAAFPIPPQVRASLTSMVLSRHEEFSQFEDLQNTTRARIDSLANLILKARVELTDMPPDTADFALECAIRLDLIQTFLRAMLTLRASLEERTTRHTAFLAKIDLYQ